MKSSLCMSDRTLIDIFEDPNIVYQHIEHANFEFLATLTTIPISWHDAWN